MGDDPARRTGEAGTVEARLREGEPYASVLSIASRVMEDYSGRPALAERAWELVTDPATGHGTQRLLPEFATISYRELWERVGAIAADWLHAGDSPLRAGEFVCTLGFTSAEYTTVDLACVRAGAVVVPLQTSATAAQLAPIVAEVEPRVVATSLEKLDDAVECAVTCDSVRRVIVFDYHPELDEHRAAFESARARVSQAGGIVLDSFATVVERGRALPPAPDFEDGPDRLALLVYTSGSTGTPKGAMYTDRLVANLWRGAAAASASAPSVGLNYLPMSHTAGRASVMRALATGGTSYYVACSDLSTFFEDMSLVRPRAMMLVPRICDMLYQRYSSEVDRRLTEERERVAVEAAVKTELRETVLGGRLRFVRTGSAPLSADMAAFIESCLDCAVHDAYGMTEAGGGVTADRRVLRPPVLDYKLVDAPESGYFRTDKPYPRGELLIKTSMIFGGYYKRPELTASVFDADGYYRTGDIMAQVQPDELIYVDRRSNVLKLSQGEFVTVSRLESVFANSPLVRQIFLYGNSERAYLLAVVVPTDDALRQVGGDAVRLRSLLQESLRETAAEAGLASYEIPRDCLIETEPFSTANGLLSDIRKLLRPRVTERYRDRLEQLYTELAHREAQELRALRNADAGQPVSDLVLRAARATLGSAEAVGPQSRFLDLGGDSLAGLSFAALLAEIFSVEVPVSVVMSPANDLRKVAEHIERARRTGRLGPGFADVHGAGSRQVRADDLTLDAFLPADVLAAAGRLAGPSGTARTVLLTGANGFLGRFLCQEWLERLAERDGKLICLVRGRDAAAARERLYAAFDSGDPELLERFRESVAGRLEVIAGDIGEPGLGVDRSTWQRLADTVDLIVHPAALVNHVLPYEQLFGPNVLGTAELIRLALTTRLKRFSYLSTVGVVTAQTSCADEDADIRVTSPIRELDETYAAGYATSKWAGEVLLREAHETYGLPVSVFRSDMILAHSRYRGQLNVPDIFTRLLLSLIASGVAPRSFYRSNTGRAHYDGLPVDFTAEAVTALGDQVDAGYRTFNVANPHDDGISLDVFVDWLAEAGRPITRIDDYSEWLDRFRIALQALPATRQQHSILPLLHAFAQPNEVPNSSGIPTERFRAAVRAAKVGPDHDIPHLSRELIGKYVADLRSLRLI